MSEAGEYYNTSRKNIGHCCNKEQYTAGRLDNKPLVWMYYDEYLQNGYVEPIRTESKRKVKVICLNNYKIYNSITNASKDLKVNGNQIGLCCQLINTYVNSKNGRLYFMYYDDYIEYGEFDFKNEVDDKSIKIFCLTTNKIYKNMKSATIEVGIDYNTLIKECRSFHYKNMSSPILHKNTNESSIWMYYEDAKTRKLTSLEDYDNNIICLNNKKIYYSIAHASKELQISNTSIKSCCSFFRIYTEKDNIKYHFMRYEDYLKYGEFKFEELENKKHDKIICININKIYKNFQEPARNYKISPALIKKECIKFHFKGENSPIINQETGEETTWMYYEDYIAQNQK